ncbi:hypothetical protein NA56DRAFT_695929 [Hyaloscypha hepaticicola]|uniref:Uncharacterized protein n=1 Tax=Hyaloscypha hepaticicola TaxID=2082293 RepID=A0A2J6QPK0_9HELO|nr:hypothetical protein NA56DRAFT_695929 [Hyaloscypha hepaticicola]
MEAAESQRARFYARSDVSGTCFRDAMFAIAGQILCIGPMVAEIPQDPCISDKGDVVNLAQLTALAPGSLRSALHFSQSQLVYGVQDPLSNRPAPLSSSRKALRCAPLLSSLCKLAKRCVVPMSSASKHRGNEAGKQAPSQPCSSTKVHPVHRHGMNTLTTGTKLQPSRLLVFANDAKMSLPLSTRYWNLDTADSMISRTPD